MHYIESLIDRQIRQWELSQEFQRRARTQSLSYDPLITMARTPGSYGEEIARALALRLKFHLFDHDIIDLIADDIGVQPKRIELLDENPRSELKSWFDGILRGRIVDSYDYLKSLTRLVRIIQKQGGAIIMGRGANIILGHNGGFHVRITASHKVRIQRIAKINNISIESARKLMDAIYRTRKEYIRNLFDKDLDDNENYDLTINTDDFDINDAVILIEMGYREKCSRLLNPNNTSMLT